MGSTLAGIYPVLDVLLLLLTLNLAFSTAGRLVSFRLLALGMTAILAGDVGYAWIGAHGQLTGQVWLDLPYLLAHTCFGACALHPSLTG